MEKDWSNDTIKKKRMTPLYIVETLAYSYDTIRKILQIELQVIQCVPIWIPRMLAAVNRSVSQLTD